MAHRRVWEDKWFDGGNSPERSLWTMAGPSRRLRKLYKLLLDKDCEIEAARTKVYCAEHAPSDCRIRRNVLSKLYQERELIVKRIDLLQNYGE